MKWAFLAVAAAACILSFLMATDDGYAHQGLVFTASGVGLIAFVVFIVLDWRQEREFKREQALSEERAQIIGEFVHKTGGKRRA